MTNRNWMGGCLWAAVALLSSGGLKGDQAVTTEYSMGAAKHTMKTLTKDNMTRTEPDAKHAMILRPEAMIVLDLEKKTFARTAIASTITATAARKGGLVKTRVEVTDTGETRPAFGQTAQHLLVKMTSTAGADACHPVDLRVETDGWYLDIAPPASTPVAQNASTPADCIDEQQVETTGIAKAGFPVEYTSKTWQDGKGPVLSAVKLLAYATDTLDASLFDVPAGFTDSQPTVVKDASRLVGVAAGTGDLHTRAAAVLNTELVYALAMKDDSIETAKQNNYAYMLVLEQPDATPKKASKFAKLTKAVTGEKADLHYRLLKVEDGSTLMEADATGKSGSGLKTAMAVAQVAAPVVIMMTGPGMLQSLFSNQAALQSLLGANPALGGMGGMDPNLSSMAMMTRLLSPGGGVLSTLVAGTPANANAAADLALHQIAKAVAEQIGPSK